MGSCRPLVSNTAVSGAKSINVFTTLLYHTSHTLPISECCRGLCVPSTGCAWIWRLVLCLTSCVLLWLLWPTSGPLLHRALMRVDVCGCVVYVVKGICVMKGIWVSPKTAPHHHPPVCCWDVLFWAAFTVPPGSMRASSACSITCGGVAAWCQSHLQTGDLVEVAMPVCQQQLPGYAYVGSGYLVGCGVAPVQLDAL